MIEKEEIRAKELPFLSFFIETRQSYDVQLRVNIENMQIN
jgi:hypothetical protein